MPAQLPVTAPSHTSDVQAGAAHTQSFSVKGAAMLCHPSCLVVIAHMHCTQMRITAA